MRGVRSLGGAEAESTFSQASCKLKFCDSMQQTVHARDKLNDDLHERPVIAASHRESYHLGLSFCLPVGRGMYIIRSQSLFNMKQADVTIPESLLNISRLLSAQHSKGCECSSICLLSWSYQSNRANKPSRTMTHRESNKRMKTQQEYHVRMKTRREYKERTYIKGQNLLQKFSSSWLNQT